MDFRQITASVADRADRVEKSLRTGTLSASDAVALTESYVFVYKDGPTPKLGMGRSGAAEPATANDQTGVIWFTTSVYDPEAYPEDRDGDVVFPKGRLGYNYARNPVWFFGHQQWEVPIGTGWDEKNVVMVEATEKKLRQGCRFDRADPDADFLYGKVKRGMLNATSIAFVPVEAYRRDAMGGVGFKAHPHHQDGAPVGWFFKVWDHTETSIVGVPSNAEALRDSFDREKSFISPRFQKALWAYCAQSKGCWNGWCPMPFPKEKHCCGSCKDGKTCEGKCTKAPQGMDPPKPGGGKNDITPGAGDPKNRGNYNPDKLSAANVQSGRSPKDGKKGVVSPAGRTEGKSVQADMESGPRHPREVGGADMEPVPATNPPTSAKDLNGGSGVAGGYAIPPQVMGERCDACYGSGDCSECGDSEKKKSRCAECLWTGVCGKCAGEGRVWKAAGVRKYITHDGDKWKVHAESGRVLGTHDSKEDAQRQLAAVEANKHKGAPVAVSKAGCKPGERADLTGCQPVGESAADFSDFGDEYEGAASGVTGGLPANDVEPDTGVGHGGGSGVPGMRPVDAEDWLDDQSDVNRPASEVPPWLAGAMGGGGPGGEAGWIPPDQWPDKSAVAPEEFDNPGGGSVDTRHIKSGRKPEGNRMNRNLNKAAKDTVDEPTVPRGGGDGAGGGGDDLDIASQVTAGEGGDDAWAQSGAGGATGATPDEAIGMAGQMMAGEGGESGGAVGSFDDTDMGSMGGPAAGGVGLDSTVPSPPPTAQILAGLHAHAKSEADWLGQQLNGLGKLDVSGMDENQAMDTLNKHFAVRRALEDYQQNHVPSRMEHLAGLFGEHHPDQDMEGLMKGFTTDDMTAGAETMPGEAGMVNTGEVPPDPSMAGVPPDDPTAALGDDIPPEDGAPPVPPTDAAPVESETMPSDPSTAEIHDRYQDKSGKWVTRKVFARRTKSGAWVLVRKGDGAIVVGDGGLAASERDDGRPPYNSAKGVAQEDQDRGRPPYNSAKAMPDAQLAGPDDDQINTIQDGGAALEDMSQATDIPKHWKAIAKAHANALKMVAKALNDKGHVQRNGGGGRSLQDKGKEQRNGGGGGTLSNMGNPDELKPGTKAVGSQVSKAVEQDFKNWVRNMSRITGMPVEQLLAKG